MSFLNEYTLKKGSEEEDSQEVVATEGHFNDLRKRMKKILNGLTDIIAHQEFEREKEVEYTSHQQSLSSSFVLLMAL